MNFSAQYQQRPAPARGGMIKAAWLQRFRLADPPPFDRIVQSWDTANKPSELSDYSVCTTWGLRGPRFCLLNVLRKKRSYPELRRAVVEQDRLFRPQTIVIEDRASGTQLIQGVNRRREGTPHRHGKRTPLDHRERFIPGVHRGDPRVATRAPRGWRSVARGAPVGPRG